MNFFRSVFADDPDPPSPISEPESDITHHQQHQRKENPDMASPQNPNPSSADADAAAGDAWSFGGLIKTLTTKSESVIETYRRDLQEFGSGLKKELEVAQGSLGTVSTVIDEFGHTVLKGTAQIISHGKDAILAVDQESDSSDNNNNNLNNSGNQKRYSRFDAQVRTIQGDVNTYCEEVDDLDDFNKWKSGFVLDDMSEEIESLFEENGAMENIYKRVVPNNVDHETFWLRYFYRLFKLKQAEDLRASLVKRAISREEEDLTWDVDDEEDDNENESESSVVAKANVKEIEDVGGNNSGKLVVEQATDIGKSDLSENKELGDKASEEIAKEELLQGEKISKSNEAEDGKESVAEPRGNNVVVNEKVAVEKSDRMNKENSGLKSGEEVTSVDKAEQGQSSKDGGFSVVPSQPSVAEEEDLGWDEIEDLSSIDDKKVTHFVNPNRAGLRKRLSVAEEEEDLSWDIEDEDEPVKA